MLLPYSFKLYCSQLEVATFTSTKLSLSFPRATQVVSTVVVLYSPIASIAPRPLYLAQRACVTAQPLLFSLIPVYVSHVIHSSQIVQLATPAAV
jgi:hypothetical protein